MSKMSNLESYAFYRVVKDLVVSVRFTILRLGAEEIPATIKTQTLLSSIFWTHKCDRINFQI